MVPSRSSSSAAPSRAKRRRRRRATLMLRVPSSTLSSRLRYSRFSQTLTAERCSLLPPKRMPSGCVPPCPKGDVPPASYPLVATRRGARSARPGAPSGFPSVCPSRIFPAWRARRRSGAFSSPGAASLRESARPCRAVPRRPLKYSPKARSNLSKLRFVLDQRSLATARRSRPGCVRPHVPASASSNTRNSLVDTGQLAGLEVEEEVDQHRRFRRRLSGCGEP
jgi:hypothetical protein